jgi:hypothetical protein
MAFLLAMTAIRRSSAAAAKYVGQAALAQCGAFARPLAEG